MTTITIAHTRSPATDVTLIRAEPLKAAILTALAFCVACFFSLTANAGPANVRCNEWLSDNIAQYNRNPLHEPWVPLNSLQLRLPAERPWAWLWMHFRKQSEFANNEKLALLNHLWFSITTSYAGDRWVAILQNTGQDTAPNRELLTECLAQVQDQLGFEANLPSQPPRDYQSYKRWISLNAVTEPMVLWQLKKELAGYQDRWRKPARLPVRHYLPPEVSGSIPTPGDVSPNLLDFPVPSPGALEQMMALYAPVISVADPRHVNAPGAIQWENGALTHQPSEPTAYTSHGFVSYRGHTLLQLSYQIWFRKPRSPQANDVTSGLNYILWRVTLKPDGNVLFYESVRGDGLFHGFYPVSRGLELKPGLLSTLPYPNTVPNARQERVELVIEPDSHLVIRANSFHRQQNERSYQLRPHQQLMALQDSNEYRSIYAADATVYGSQASPAQAFLLGISNFGQLRAPHRLPVGIERVLHWDDPELPSRILQ